MCDGAVYCGCGEALPARVYSHHAGCIQVTHHPASSQLHGVYHFLMLRITSIAAHCIHCSALHPYFMTLDANKHKHEDSSSHCRNTVTQQRIMSQPPLQQTNWIVACCNGMRITAAMPGTLSPSLQWYRPWLMACPRRSNKVGTETFCA